MKHLTSRVVILTACICALFTSCSKKYDSVEDQIKAFVPAETNLVANIDIERLARVSDSKISSDGVVTLSPYMERLLSQTMGQQARAFMAGLSEFKGAGMKNVLIAADMVSNRAIVLTPLRNEDKFIESMLGQTALKFGQTGDVGGYKVLESSDFTVLVNDHLAFIAIGKQGPLDAQQSVALIDNWRNKAKNAHLADWKIDRIKHGDIANVLIDVNTMSRLASQTAPVADWLTLAVNIDGKELSVKSNAYTAQGKDADVKGVKNFDTSLLSYVTPTDIVVTGAGLDMKVVGEQLTQYALSEGLNSSDVAQLDEVVKLFDGSVMFAAGPIAGLNSFTQFDLTTWHFVLAANADGKAVRNLIEKNVGQHFDADGSMRVPAGTRYNPDTMDYEPVMLRIYTLAEGNVFVLSNSPVTTDGNPGVKKDLFKNHYFGLWASLPKSNVALSQLHLPFGITIEGEAKKNKSELELTLTDTDKNFVEALVSALIGD